MKRTYEKPLLFAERFELTQMLSSCSVLIGSFDNKCVLADEDATPRMKSAALIGYFMGNCKAYYIGQDGEDGMCYHVAGNMVFSS